PVLYVKTANTWSPHGNAITVPAAVPEVEVGASIGMVIGAEGDVEGFVLMNDLSIPHASFFRPPVKFKCVDGFLGIGPVLRDAQEV
ncbi:fumarylacetoacetate hydrolase, partial [Mycobacterium tuberculosis]